MTFFGRMMLRKIDPYHDAQGKFTTAGGAFTHTTDSGVVLSAKTKTGLVQQMLLHPQGTTTEKILAATGWPSVSVPATAKAGNLELTKEKVGGKIVYKATPAGQTQTPASSTASPVNAAQTQSPAPPANAFSAALDKLVQTPPNALAAAPKPDLSGASPVNAAQTNTSAPAATHKDSAANAVYDMLNNGGSGDVNEWAKYNPSKLKQFLGDLNNNSVLKTMSSKDKAESVFNYLKNQPEIKGMASSFESSSLGKALTAKYAEHETGVKPSSPAVPVGKTLTAVQNQAFDAHVKDMLEGVPSLIDAEKAQVSMAVKDAYQKTTDVKSFTSALNNKISGISSVTPPEATAIKNMPWSAVYNQVSNNPNDLKAASPDNTKKGNTSIDGFKCYDGPVATHTDLANDMHQSKVDSGNQSALTFYKGSGYRELNRLLRSGEPIPELLADHIGSLDKVTKLGTVPAGTVLFRGVQDFTDMHFTDPSKLKPGQWLVDNGYMSTSSNLGFAKDWASGNVHPMLLQLKFTNPVSAVHVGRARGYDNEGEKEVLLKSGLRWKVVGYHKEKGTGYTKKLPVLTLETAG